MENLPEKAKKPVSVPKGKTGIKPIPKPKEEVKPVKKKPVNKVKKATGMTVMQTSAVKKLEQKVAEGGKVVLKEILESTGYSEKTAKTPQKVFGKPAVAKKLKELGLTPD